MNDEIDELKARVAELERRIEILFSNTGAIDFEEAGREHLRCRRRSRNYCAATS